MYNNSVRQELQVKETMFREIFSKDFNIGFNSPSMDVCSTCVLLKNKLKTETNDSEENTLKTQLKVHNMRAKAFYAATKQRPPETYVLVFFLII